MKTKVNSRKETTGARCAGTQNDVRISYTAYGDLVPICVNTECVMRKQTVCFGFEGCPGLGQYKDNGNDCKNDDYDDDIPVFLHKILYGDRLKRRVVRIFSF